MIVLNVTSYVNVVLMALEIDFSLKAFLAALNDTAEWLVIGVLSLMSDSVNSLNEKLSDQMFQSNSQIRRLTERLEACNTRVRFFS